MRNLHPLWKEKLTQQSVLVLLYVSSMDLT